MKDLLPFIIRFLRNPFKNQNLNHACFADKRTVVLLLALGPIMNDLRTVRSHGGSTWSTLHGLLFSASNANPQKPEVSNLLAGVSGADLMCKDIAVFATRYNRPDLHNSMSMF